MKVLPEITGSFNDKVANNSTKNQANEFREIVCGGNPDSEFYFVACVRVRVHVCMWWGWSPALAHARQVLYY
jgi:hypothetical protein